MKRLESFSIIKSQEEPLKVSSPLTGLGQSVEEALIVVVPSSFAGGQSTADNEFLPILRELIQTNLEVIRENQNIAAKKDFSMLEVKSYKSDNDNNRLQWLIHYGMVSPTCAELPKDAYCHLLGGKVPLKYLNCSHLFQKRWYRHVRDFGLSSINSEKNILILLKIFEVAFDAGRFVLLADKQTGVIRCKILDDGLKKKELHQAMKDVFPHYNREVDFKGKTCFGDFDGQELHFLNMERPLMRCLSLHALVARKHAIDVAWIDSDELKELDDEDIWSDGFLDEKTRKMIDVWRSNVCTS